MTTDPSYEPTHPPQEPDGTWTGVISLLALGFVVITGVLVGISWLFVEQPSAGLGVPPPPSPLETTLIERAAGGQDIRAQGARRLEQYGWVDRNARIVRIPIDRAIEAVVSDPALIGPTVTHEATR